MNVLRIILFLAIVASSTNIHAQKIRYRDVKNEFKTRDYRNLKGEKKYSPLAAAICNYAFPSVGYFYIDEPVRGSVVLGLELASSSLMIAGLVKSVQADYGKGNSVQQVRNLVYAGFISSGAVFLWSIFDVVHVARVKNMAYNNRELSMHIHPEILSVSTVNSEQKYGAGLTFALRF